MADDELPATPLRRRVLIFVLAVVAAVTIVWLLLYRPGDAKRGLPRASSSALPPCKPGEQRDCVGGKTEVIVVVPPAEAVSPPRRTAP